MKMSPKIQKYKDLFSKSVRCPFKRKFLIQLEPKLDSYTKIFDFLKKNYSIT